MGNKLNVGLIGLGGICNYCHMPAYMKMEDINIAAICDVAPGKIETFKEKWAMPDVPSFTDYREFLAHCDLDFVDIATPNYLHSEIAVSALEHGIHVFCEKPDAISAAEALRMKDAAEKNNRHLMVMRNNRYLPTSRFLKEYIEEGKMGEIYCGRCGWQRRRGIPGKGGWFTTKKQSGGGPLIDLGVHFIDLAIWMMGNPKPVAVSGCTYQKFSNTDVSDSFHAVFGERKENGTFDVEDLAMGFIRFDNGACLQIEFSWASNIEKEKFFVELRGTKSGSTFENGKLKIFTEEDGSCIDLNPVTVNEIEGITGHAENLQHFANVLLRNAQPDFLPVQGVNMIKILEAMYKSADCGREILLTDSEE